jgi:cell division protein FtsQ
VTAAPTRERPRAPVDPRIEDRRAHVAREVGRRRRRALVVVFVALAIPTGAYLAVRSPLLDVDHIDARSTRHVTAAEITAALGVRAKEPLAFVRPGTVARRLEEKIPWVARARVERRWPGTLRVRVTDRRAVAAVRGDNGAWALVSADGRVLERRVSAPAGLFQVTGARAVGGPGTRIAPAAAARVALDLPPALRLRAIGLELGRTGAVLRLAPGAGPEIRLGSLADLAAKAVAALAVIDRLPPEELAALTYLDVRAPSAPAGGSTPVDAATAADPAGPGPTASGPTAPGPTAPGPTGIPGLDAPVTPPR